MAGGDRQTRHALLGGLLIAALTVVALLVFFLDRLIGFAQRDFTVVAVMPAAPGIGRGTPVWIGGGEVGEVSAVAFMPFDGDTTATLALTLEVPHRLRAQLRADSRVKLTSARMIGVRVVDISAGSAAAPALEEGDTIFVQPGTSLAHLTARAGGIRAELDSVMQSLRALGPPVVARMDDTRRAFDGMNVAMNEALQLGAAISAGPGMALMANPEFTASLEHARTHARDLPALLGGLRERSGEARDVGAALARLQARADSLTLQLDAVAIMLDTPNGSAGRFLQDSALFKAIGAARTDLDSLIAEARRNPLRYIF
ncbi:MAG: MlaD family protein [Gemmatimonadota bacterium]